VIADSGFTMQLDHFDGTRIPLPCRLTRAEGTIARVRADTVWLAPISLATPQAGENTDCRLITRGYFARGSGADLRIVASRMEVRRTRNTVILTSILTILMAIIIDDYLQGETVY
jgi:hypothetical protein